MEDRIDQSANLLKKVVNFCKTSLKPLASGVFLFQCLAVFIISAPGVVEEFGSGKQLHAI